MLLFFALLLWAAQCLYCERMIFIDILSSFSTLLVENVHVLNILYVFAFLNGGKLRAAFQSEFIVSMG